METSVLSPLGDLDSSSGTSDTMANTMSGYLGHHQGLYVNGPSKFKQKIIKHPSWIQQSFQLVLI